MMLRQFGEVLIELGNSLLKGEPQLKVRACCPWENILQIGQDLFWSLYTDKRTL